MRYSMSYSIPRCYSFGGEPYTASITQRWRISESGIGLQIPLANEYGSDTLIPMLGQALDFDGIDDKVSVNYAWGELIDGQTSLTIGTIVKINSFPASGTVALYGPSRGGGSQGPLPVGIAVGTGGTLYFRFRYNDTVQTYALTSFGVGLTAGKWYVIVAQFAPTGTAGTVKIYRKNLTDGATSFTETSVNLTLATTFSHFEKYNSSTSDAISSLGSPTDTAYCDGTEFSGAATAAIVTPAVMESVLANPKITGAEAEAVLGSRCYVHFFDAGTGSTFADVTGNDYGHAPTMTLSSGASGNTTAAMCWENGANQPYIPQKGLSGGAYTGGLGAKSNITLDSTADTDNPMAITVAEYDQYVSGPVTIECWIYKANATGTNDETFWSFSPAFTTASNRRGASLCTKTGSTLGLRVDRTNILDSYEEQNISVETNASGWWYVACVISAVSCHIYVAQPADTDVTEGEADSAWHSIEPVVAGDYRLCIGARPANTSGEYQNNLPSGNRVSDLVIHEGVELSSNAVKKRFLYSKATYGG